MFRCLLQVRLSSILVFHFKNTRLICVVYIVGFFNSLIKKSARFARIHFSLSMKTYQNQHDFVKCFKCNIKSSRFQMFFKKAVLKNSDTVVSLEYCKVFINSSLSRTSLVAAFVILLISCLHNSLFKSFLYLRLQLFQNGKIK